MKGRQLAELCEQYPDFEFRFRFTDGITKFPNIRDFAELELCDIGHSDGVVILTGTEY